MWEVLQRFKGQQNHKEHPNWMVFQIRVRSISWQTPAWVISISWLLSSNVYNNGNRLNYFSIFKITSRINEPKTSTTFTTRLNQKTIQTTNAIDATQIHHVFPCHSTHLPVMLLPSLHFPGYSFWFPSISGLFCLLGNLFSFVTVWKCHVLHFCLYRISLS